MKKVTLLLGAFLTLFMISCEVNGVDGREGPQGPEGIPGKDAITAKVIDIDATFTAEDNYRARYSFGNEIEVLPTDVILVYNLWEQVDGDDGNLIDVWRPLPQTRLVNQGILQYNFEHTFVDVDVFIETDFDPALLMPGDTDNLTFRIAVLPAEGTGKSSLDRSNVSSVMAYLGVEEKDVQKIKL